MQVSNSLLTAMKAADASIHAGAPDVLDRLMGVEAGLREMLAAEARLTPAQRRERSARQWEQRQRYEERVGAYNEAVGHVDRERGRAHNAAAAAKVRAQTCMSCFQMPAANGECGC
ncbi:hypothetical protein [Streptomyces sp. NPDC086782]|uniref:hypothetical protein n=1 Tax=Streptomyces sp. NPDC086782 TaxID=3365757 RepID=UPI003801E753